MRSLVNKIVANWGYWQVKFVKAKILIAKETGCLISRFDAVLKELGKYADGLMLVDKYLKKQLQKSGGGGAIFHLADEFMLQLEKFLTRGNRFETTEAGLLKELGGIALLRNNGPGSTAGRPSGGCADSGGSIY